MLKIFLSSVWFIIIPILLGLLITHFMKKNKNNLLYSILIGYFCEFSIYQLLTIPFTYMEKSFNSLYYTSLGICLFLSIISIIINFKEIKNILKNIRDSIKKISKILLLIILVIIGFQCYYGYRYMHIDEDDSNFVAKATISLQTNTLYKYSDTGEVNTEFPVRYVFSPFPVYTAAVAKFTGYHPMAIAHTAFPVIFLVLIYINYYLLGNILFKGDKNRSLVFLIFVSLLYMFGDDINLRSNFRFALVRLWQGKAVLGNLIIPAIIVMYDGFVEDEKKFSNWIAVFFTMFSSCLVSTMGFALAPVMLGTLIIIYSIKNIVEKKSFKEFLKFSFCSLLCCAPNLVYAAMYAIEKGVK